jgi:thioredoxin reductase (NADPH)
MANLRKTQDALIIGGGVAGLTAASYLGRFRRPTLVVDARASRARWIPESHNIPGFPGGIGGKELLARLTSQAETYGARILSGRVDSITRTDGGFAVELDAETIHTRFVLLATGIQDHLPPMAGAEEALLRSVLRVCPICDGFEAVNKKIAVVGDGASGEREAEFLRTYSEHVCYIHVADRSDSSRHQRLKDLGILYADSTRSLLLRPRRQSHRPTFIIGCANEFKFAGDCLVVRPRRSRVAPDRT